MANERDRDELDDDLPAGDEVRGLDEDEFEEAEDLDEDELSEEERVTGEVGSEGGSPGERVRTRRPDEPLRGSEATETTRKPR